MTGFMLTFFAACAAFLLGSFPSGVVVTYIVTGRDVRRHGSGNIGASNVSSAAGLPVGITVGILDILKGIVAVLLAKRLGLQSAELSLVALAAVMGHNFSIFLRFRGGKGVATSFGVALPLTPAAAALAMVSWLVGTLSLGYASAGSLLALALMPVFMALMRSDPAYILLGMALFLLSAVRHRKNILRLMSGTERKIRRPW